MHVYDITVSSKGQITLPSEVRKLWNLNAGDHVELFSHEGRHYLRPRNSPPTAFFDNLPQRPKKRNLTDDEGIALAVAERDERSKSRSAAE